MQYVNRSLDPMQYPQASIKNVGSLPSIRNRGSGTVSPTNYPKASSNNYRMKEKPKELDLEGLRNQKRKNHDQKLKEQLKLQKQLQKQIEEYQQ